VKRQAPKARAGNPWDPARMTFHTVKETMDRLRALAKREGMKVNSLFAEAVYIHLHRLESNGDPKLRRKSVCWSCGTKMDAASGGTTRAGPKAERKKP